MFCKRLSGDKISRRKFEALAWVKVGEDSAVTRKIQVPERKREMGSKEI